MNGSGREREKRKSIIKRSEPEGFSIVLTCTRAPYTSNRFCGIIYLKICVLFHWRRVNHSMRDPRYDWKLIEAQRKTFTVMWSDWNSFEWMCGKSQKRKNKRSKTKPTFMYGHTQIHMHTVVYKWNDLFNAAMMLLRPIANPAYTVIWGFFSPIIHQFSSFSLTLSLALSPSVVCCVVFFRFCAYA